ncbi:hypothetical protein SDC9_91921 [bioreactor metagenome]|uniref:Uncharacterized protein n=1 Tax=bioreactor metagenome TaxID=1076179 RepID=A0A644ZWB8_9ZZZZ
MVGCRRGRLPLSGCRSLLGVELLAVAAAFLHLPEQICLILDAGQQRPVECLYDEGLGVLGEKPGVRGRGIQCVRLVVGVVVLDAVARIDDAAGDHRQDCVDVGLGGGLQESAAGDILLILERELSIEAGEIVPQEGVCPLHGGDSVAQELDRETALKREVKAFNSTLPLRYGGGLELDAQCLAGGGELGEGVLLLIGLGQGLVLEYGPSVGPEPRGDAVEPEDHVQNVVIAVQCLLGVEPSPHHLAGCIVDGHMQVPLAGPLGPDQLAGVHLDHLPEVFAPRPARMRVGVVQDRQGGVDLLALGLAEVLLACKHPQFLLHQPLGRLLRAGRDEHGLLEDRVHRPVGEADAVVLLEYLQKMGEAGGAVGVLVQPLDQLPRILRYGGGGLAALVAVAEPRQVFAFAPLHVLQERLAGASELRPAPPDGRIGAAEVDDFLSRGVLFLLVRSQILQFHLTHPPRGGLRRSAPSSAWVSCRFSPLGPIVGPMSPTKMQRLLDCV